MHRIGRGGNVSLDGCGNDRVAEVNVPVKKRSHRRKDSGIQIEYICSQMHLPGLQRGQKQHRKREKLE